MNRLLTFCLMLLVPFSTYAKNLVSPEECQNAAASLVYYLEQVCLSLEGQDNPSECIPFSEENVLDLWATIENFCGDESYQTHAWPLRRALHAYRQIDFSKPKEETFSLLFSCFLQVHSLWLDFIGEDPVKVSLETMQDLADASHDFAPLKQLWATIHACSQIQKKLTTPLPEKEKHKLTNLLTWVNHSGAHASATKWQTWKEYYTSSTRDPLKATFKLSASYNDFKENPYLSSAARKKLSPYLLPAGHAVKSPLDSLFLHARATQDSKALKDSNFQILSVQGRSFIHVLSHPSFSQYLLKAVLDCELRKKRGKPEWEWFARRCEYAKKIAEIIQKYHIKSFIVPQKWVYPLPLNPCPPLSKAYKQKPVVLVVQKMDLVPFQQTLDVWKNHIQKKQLKELYTIVSKLSRVSIRPDNLPLTTSGQFAFVDTEYVRSSPSYGFIRPYLSQEMRSYWDQLVSKGGK
ncbi:hypothetical protein [Parachlamydia sp. AcF125]|uniref:hypothetical protein n=1 Tax=Parachlamydia sp. AcF125 TaxID=2795736 RepID=UPI001BC996E6|nr:hypothetical protein [Parachlamydia sp. AcF125]MBS4169102.1 hypothetical protein [Parachlamydia sp. AcF125]